MSRIINYPMGGAGVPITKNYTVFIDESFNGFLGLSSPDGYFCYVALMVPTARLADLARFWQSYRNRLVSAYKTATGFDLGNAEFKSNYLNKLDFSSRKGMAERLKSFLAKNDCFIGGFYTTVDSFGLYNLRTEVGKDDDTKELPINWAEQLVLTKEKLLKSDVKNGPAGCENVPGDARLLFGLLHATLEISLNWLGGQGISFEVVYDPRQKKEDAFLLKHVGDWLKDEKASFKRYPGVFRGATSNTPSGDSPGLMLADLLLRDLRFLFSDLPGLMSESSSTGLILPIPHNDEPLIMVIDGHRFKAGSIRPMSSNLAAALRKPTTNSMMPLFCDRLADMKISYYAKWGEARTVNFQDWTFTDMVD
jgi:hypothetical protein